MEPVKIYPATNLYKELPPETNVAVLDWFRANGVDPCGVVNDKEVVITDVIDFWWYTKPKTPIPENAHSLEQSWSAGDYPLSHLQVHIETPLPEDLAEALRAVNARWSAREAELKAKLYGLNDPCPKCGHQR